MTIYPYRHDITITLRGIQVCVEFNVGEPDSSVGLFGYQLDEYRLSTADDGDELDWDLTQDEIDEIAIAVDQYLRDSEYD